MENKKKLIFIASAFVVLLLVAGVLYKGFGTGFSSNQISQQPNGQNPEEKLEAMDFTVYDADGNEVHLFDFIGKPIVLNFWASWCGPCRSEMPEFNAASQELEGEVQFLMINATDGSRETVKKAKTFVEENGYTFPVYYDTEMEAGTIYSAYALPTTYFIDAEGYVVAKASGAIDAELLQKGLDMIYAPEQ